MSNSCAAAAALLALALTACASPGAQVDEQESSSLAVKIVRDDYGVPHIYGPTDASVAFGLGYAQAEDDLAHVEDNLIAGIGRSAEIWGGERWRNDLLVHALELPRIAQAEYKAADPALQAIYTAYARGLNAYVAQHPGAKLQLLKRFEPWHCLAFVRFKYFVQEFLGYAGVDLSAIAIGADGSLAALASTTAGGTHEQRFAQVQKEWREPLNGSNAWAVGPSKSASGNALLFINPHVRFTGIGTYYESHLISEEGWNFSGVGRYGFPFAYMGHNESLGWGHTDNYSDHGDLYAEVFDHPSDRLAYRYGEEYRQATEWQRVLRIKTDGGIEERAITFRKTHHGPLLFTRRGRPVAVRLANLERGGWFAQHYAMTRANNLEEFRAALEMQRINYMNIVYADADGNIQYIYNGIVPRRDPNFYWGGVVDGSNPKTEWQGVHALDELPQILNPDAGFVLNTNCSPFVASASNVPRRRDFPDYMIGPEIWNTRAQVSSEILTEVEQFDFESWSRAALDTRVYVARDWIAALSQDMLYLLEHEFARWERLAPQVEALEAWDCVASVDSTAMSLFTLTFLPIARGSEQGRSARVDSLEAAVNRLERDYGSVEVAWGELNRQQRVHWNRHEAFSDERESVAVPGGPGAFGMAFVFSATDAAGQRRRYGVHGNSYVSVVEFGPQLRARSIVFYGQSGDPDSPHYFDQAKIYGSAQFKPAYFERAEVLEHSESVKTLAW